MAKKKREFKLWKEFKEFINKGDAFMLAVGVVIGGAFSAIVNSLVNILTSVATWPIPGGLAGLVTNLPYATDAQRGLGAGAYEEIGLGQKFAVSDLQKLAGELAKKLYGESYTDVQFVDAKNQITTNYTLYGQTYYYNQTAIINWGALINAVIAFIIIAITLFIIVKVINTARAKKAALEAKVAAKLEGEQAAAEEPKAE